MLTINNTLDGFLKDVEIKGNTIQDASNLADIRSVGDKVEGQELWRIPVLSCGKNLFNKNKVVYNKSINTNLGYEESSNGYNITEFIPIKPNTNYRRSLGSGIYYYDKDFKFISMLSHTTISPSNAKYCKLQLINTWDLDVFQFEEGTQVTPYEPYQEDKLTILSPVQLERVGDVADRIIYKDGVWGVEKNIDRITINGNEQLMLGTFNEAGDVLGCKFVNDRMKLLDWNINDKKIYSISSIFPSISIAEASKDGSKNMEHCSLLDNQQVILRVKTAKLSEPTLVGVKQWLQVNNIELLFQLENPIFIPLPHDQQIKLRTFANKTNISFLTEIEGTIKAQVPKSLGATVNTHTEQIDSLNKELDRVKKLEESTVSTVVTESDFTTVTETSNGYFEDVKIEGRTLVNRFIDYSASAPNGYCTQVQNGYRITPKPNSVSSSLRYEFSFTTPVDLSKHSLFYELECSVESAFRLALMYEDDSSVNIDTYNNLKNHINKHYFNELEKKVKTIRVYVNNNSSWTKDDYADIKNIIILEGDHTQSPPSYFEGLMSTGEDVEEVSVESCNKTDNLEEGYKQDKKRILYYNDETQIWEKPVLRQWDSIEKHSDGKYYYHVRSGEVVLDGSELNWRMADPSSANEDNIRVYTPIQNAKAGAMVVCDKFNVVDTINYEGVKFANNQNFHISLAKNKLSSQDVVGFKQWLQANPVTVVYQLAQEEVYECTNLDLITYADETNYIVNTGAISPKSTLKVHSNISNVVKILQEKVSLLESNVKASQEVQDMMILESDMRILDIELALMEHMPITLNLGENAMLRSATYYNFLKSHIENETYEKDYLENVMNKYLATNRLTQQEYDELYKLLYPASYDIALPIE